MFTELNDKRNGEHRPRHRRRLAILQSISKPTDRRDDAVNVHGYPERR